MTPPQKALRTSFPNTPVGWTLKAWIRPPLTTPSGKPLGISICCLGHLTALGFVIVVCLLFLHKEKNWQPMDMLDPAFVPYENGFDLKARDSLVPQVQGDVRIYNPQRPGKADQSQPRRRFDNPKLTVGTVRVGQWKSATDAKLSVLRRAANAMMQRGTVATSSAKPEPGGVIPGDTVATSAAEPEPADMATTTLSRELPTSGSVKPGGSDAMFVVATSSAKPEPAHAMARTTPSHRLPPIGRAKPGGSNATSALPQRHSDAAPGGAVKQTMGQGAASVTATLSLQWQQNSTTLQSDCLQRRGGVTTQSRLAKSVAEGFQTSNKGPPLPYTFEELQPSPAWAAEAREWQVMEACRVRGNPKLHAHINQASPQTLWWNEEAEALVIRQLQETQFPRDCSKGTWLAAPTRDYGLLSSFHVFAVELVFAVAVGWTAVPLQNYRSPAFHGCPGHLRHLGCFLNFTSCAFEGKNKDRRTQQLRDAPYVKWHVLNPKHVKHGSVVLLEKAKPTKKLGPWRRRVNYWFRALWQIMLDGDMVGTYGGTKADMAEHWRREFVIMSIVTKWLFNPHPNIRNLAGDILRHYGPPPKQNSRDSTQGGKGWPQQWRVPVLGLHIRQTDKKKEDPFWKENKRYREPSDYGQAIQQLEKQQGYEFGSLLIMSDSGSVVQQYLDNPRAAGLRRNLTVMHDHLLADSVENYGGHDMVPWKKKREMQEHFLAMLYLMSEIADYAIITMSSNVGRFIIECLGARKRVEQASGVGPLGLSMDGDLRWWSDF